jgi:hypothetical protein
VRAFRHRYSAQRRQSLAALISPGVTDGEFRAGIDPELAAQALLGPIFYRRLTTRDPFDPDHVEDLLDMIVGTPDHFGQRRRFKNVRTGSESTPRRCTSMTHQCGT